MLGALAITLALPALASWVSLLAQRPWQDNLLQLLSALILVLATRKSMPRSGFRYEPSRAGLLFLAVSGCFYVLAGLLAIKSMLWGGLLMVLAGLFWSVFGNRAIRTMLPVFLFSFFLLPDMPSDIKNTVSQPLKLLSTQLTVLLAKSFIPIQSEGNIFYINGQAFEVTVACSGLHTWIGFLFGGMLWLLFEKFSWKALLAVLLSAPVLALVANSIRLFITALVAHQVSADAGVAIHTNLEYILFPVGLVVLWLLLRRLAPPAGGSADAG